MTISFLLQIFFFYSLARSGNVILIFSFGLDINRFAFSHLNDNVSYYSGKEDDKIKITWEIPYIAEEAINHVVFSEVVNKTYLVPIFEQTFSESQVKSTTYYYGSRIYIENIENHDDDKKLGVGFRSDFQEHESVTIRVSFFMANVKFGDQMTISKQGIFLSHNKLGKTNFKIQTKPFNIRTSLISFNDLIIPCKLEIEWGDYWEFSTYQSWDDE